MGLFDKERGQSAETEQAQQGSVPAADNTSYMDGVSGEGLDDLAGNMLAPSYLGMIQPGSDADTPDTPAGQWRNSATGEAYGPTVEVIVLAAKTAWVERDREPPYMTVGRYPVGGTPELRTETKRPPAGKRGYPKLFNVDTGNEIQELPIYALLLKEQLDSGLVYFTPTVGSMRTCRTWNTQLRSQRTPSGKVAPICGYTWHLTVDLVPNPAKPKEMITKLVKVTRGMPVPEELFRAYVEHALPAAQNAALLAAPGASGDVETAEAVEV